MIWQQGYNPLENMVVSTILAAVPVMVMLVGLGFLHLKAHVAAGLGLLAALVVAVFAYSMPAEMAGKAAVLGGLTGLLPIGWIVLMRRSGTSPTPALWHCRSALALRAAAPCRENRAGRPGNGSAPFVLAGATRVEPKIRARPGGFRLRQVNPAEIGRRKNPMLFPGEPVGVDGQALARPFASARGGR